MYIYIYFFLWFSWNSMSRRVSNKSLEILTFSLEFEIKAKHLNCVSLMIYTELTPFLCLFVFRWYHYSRLFVKNVFIAWCIWACVMINRLCGLSQKYSLFLCITVAYAPWTPEKPWNSNFLLDFYDSLCRTLWQAQEIYKL